MFDENHDLLDDIDVVVSCTRCHDTYRVRASVIRDSQRALAEGCSGASLYECTGSFIASLVEPEALDDLSRAWRRFAASATRHGGVGVELDRVALERWENEGGLSAAAPRSAPSRA